jgi:manganese transport protein
MSPPLPASEAIMPAGLPAADGVASLYSGLRAGMAPPGARLLRKFAAFAGPGYLVAVGYMDPGNWATDLAGGSRFGYALLPVILLSSIAAVFLQWLALRLGIASGRDLAQLCRERFSKPVSRFLWATCEIAIAACDLAEVLGSAIALKLLFGIPLLVGVCITAFDVLLILGLQRRGMRYIEALVIVLIATIAACFAFELAWSGLDATRIASAFNPDPSLLADPAALYIALGIFGATVMPHNIYLHSSIAQSRDYAPTLTGRREAIRFSTIDCVLALSLAFLVNAAILILAAAAFHGSGNNGVAELQDAHRLLTPLLGTAFASTLFAVALLAAGQNSTLTGTMAGQIVMEGFLGLRMSPALRRLLTRLVALVPATVVVAIAGEHGASRLLIFSQVLLSMQLGFAVVPLVMFTSDRAVMGPLVNRRRVAAAGYSLCGAIILANLWLVVQAL